MKENKLWPYINSGDLIFFSHKVQESCIRHIHWFTITECELTSFNFNWSEYLFILGIENMFYVLFSLLFCIPIKGTLSLSLRQLCHLWLVKETNHALYLPMNFLTKTSMASSVAGTLPLLSMYSFTFQHEIYGLRRKKQTLSSWVFLIGLFSSILHITHFSWLIKLIFSYFFLLSLQHNSINHKQLY